MRNEVKELSFQLPVKIIFLHKKHSSQAKLFSPLMTQLLKSGTSIGANIEEACAGQSRKDFLIKMYIAFKEARETFYWLRLIKITGIFKNSDLDEILKDTMSIISLLSSITKSAKQNISKTSIK